MQKSYLGIDVSKLSFDLSVLIVKDGVKKEMLTTKFENNAVGLKAFKKYLDDNGVAFNENSLLVIENTGIYHRLIWQFCSDYGLPIYIGNAADLKWSFGIARTKNDKVDSMRLCDYSYKNREDLKPTPALNKNFIILKDLLTNRSKLVRQQNAIRQTIKELKISNDKATQKMLEAINKAAIDGLKKSIKLIEAEMRKMVKADPEVLANYTLMISVPGIGEITAIFILCCTNNFAIKISGKQLASYAGVVPCEHTSGTSVKGRNKVSHMANKELKSILSMGALSAVQAYPEFGDYYERKKNEGKHHNKIMNAIKNKMLLRVVSVVNSGTPYVNNYKKAG